MKNTFEGELWQQGYQLIAGVDEVGRGALAGPVMAAAVILPYPWQEPWLDQVRDSQELTPAQRERLSPLIREKALAWGLGLVPAPEVDRLGILPATRLAMAQAVTSLAPIPHFLMVDALKLPQLPLPQKALIRGDKQCLSIACASIVAKVARDSLMRELEGLYPGYGFARHKGYATRQHLQALEKQGPCPEHRLSFCPLKG